MRGVICTNCSRPYPDDALPYRCPTCGGIYDHPDPPAFDPACLEPELMGIWRYRHTFNLPPTAPLISLGEGDTPLIWVDVYERKVGFKLEYLNPTGSFKDRGTALLVSALLARGVRQAVEDSSGNAGSSFAAYAARAGLTARVFVPDYASRPKRAQIQAYGAELVRILGPRSNAAKAVQIAAENGAVYASHAYLPFGSPGFSTIAYELYDQVGAAPGTLVIPTGHGNLLVGVAKGFQALKNAGLVDRLPVIVGVQALACAPLWAVFTTGAAGLGWVSEGETLAEGVRILKPVRGDAVLRWVSESRGLILAVEEDKILPGRDQLARRGFFVEPTSALVWEALVQLTGRVPEPIVVLLTGTGFKSIT